LGEHWSVEYELVEEGYIQNVEYWDIDARHEVLQDLLDVGFSGLGEIEAIGI